MLYLLLSYSVFFLLNNQTIILLTKEDGLFETFGAVSYLIASILFFILFFKSKQGNDFYFVKINKNIFFLLLGCLFLFAFGEEISWGQRIFHFRTPELLEGINVQREINIHNLYGLQKFDAEGRQSMSLPHKAFSLFWLAYCLIIPILNKFISNGFKWLKTINLPVVPIFIGVFFLANYLMQRLINLYILDVMHGSLIEIKECNFAFLFLAASIWFFSTFQKKDLV